MGRKRWLVVTITESWTFVFDDEGQAPVTTQTTDLPALTTVTATFSEDNALEPAQLAEDAPYIPPPTDAQPGSSCGAENIA